MFTMSEETRIYRKYDSLVKRFLLLGGICPVRRGRSIVYSSVSICSVFCSFLSLCTMINFCLQNSGNISLLTASFTLVASTVNTIVKTCCFSVYQKKLKQVRDTLDSLLEEALSETRLMSVVFFGVRTFYRLVCIQYVLMAGTMFTYVTKPVIKMLLYDRNDTNVQYPLCLPAVYPWSIDSMFMWQLHYLFEINIAWFMFHITAGVDAFFSFCMFRVSATLHFLAFQFESILSSSSATENHSYEENDRRVFERCVDKHVLLLKCRDSIQQVYGPAILMITIINAVGMCTLTFQAFQVKGMSVGKIAALAIFLFVKLLQTFLYAWSGAVVFTESELFRSKVYFSDWYKGNSSFAKSFSLVLLQRPIILRACDLMQVSLSLFAKTLNTTISYYFLLGTFDTDK